MKFARHFTCCPMPFRSCRRNLDQSVNRANRDALFHFNFHFINAIISDCPLEAFMLV